MSRTLHLTEQLISLPSITPEDAGCLDLLAARLAPLGFVCERLTAAPPTSVSATCGQNGLQPKKNQGSMLLKP